MFNLLAHDHGYFVKYSVMGWLQQWFGLRPNKNLILMLGLGLQCIPLCVFIIKEKLWRSGSLQLVNSKSLERWQSLFAASWLLWMVIFNHMAESATYVIAVGGAMLTLSQIFSGSNPSMEGSNNSQAAQIVKHYVSSHGSWAFGFLILLLFTMLGPTDIYPKEVRFWIVETAQLKAFPCILLWGMGLLEMFKVVRN
jgi:hypothetical protein